MRHHLIEVARVKVGVSIILQVVATWRIVKEGRADSRVAHDRAAAARLPRGVRIPLNTVPFDAVKRMGCSQLMSELMNRQQFKVASKGRRRAGCSLAFDTVKASGLQRRESAATERAEDVTDVVIRRSDDRVQKRLVLVEHGGRQKGVKRIGRVPRPENNPRIHDQIELQIQLASEDLIQVCDCRHNRLLSSRSTAKERRVFLSRGNGEPQRPQIVTVRTRRQQQPLLQRFRARVDARSPDARATPTRPQ